MQLKADRFKVETDMYVILCFTVLAWILIFQSFYSPSSSLFKHTLLSVIQPNTRLVSL